MNYFNYYCISLFWKSMKFLQLLHYIDEIIKADFITTNKVYVVTKDFQKGIYILYIRTKISLEVAIGKILII